jgi:apolipoprotein N-acyltransferase
MLLAMHAAAAIRLASELLVALVAGALLSASDHPLRLWWLQFVAFVPFWWALDRARTRGAATWPLGLVFGIGYAAPTLATVGFAPPLLAAATANLAQWTLLAPIVARLFGRGRVVGPLAAAAAITLAEIVVWHAVPMFGTAQCFVRPLSLAPGMVAFVAYTGTAGLVFVLVASQALLVAALTRPGRTASLATLALLITGVAIADVVRWTRPLGPSLGVATIGWGEDRHDLFEHLPEVARDAAARGAKLLVTPETSIGAFEQNTPHLHRIFGELAQQHGLALALGIWCGSTNDNRIWFFAADGTLRGEYRKTHLIPWLEDYVAGDGTLHLGDVAGSSLGGMICQDDNFTDVARGYGRAGTRLVAVPTNDWAAIRVHHFENGVFRAIENGYAIARAASGGISAIVDARGRIVAEQDHVATGPGVLLADVATGDGVPTLYARLGDLPMAVAAALLLALALLRRSPQPAT